MVLFQNFSFLIVLKFRHYHAFFTSFSVVSFSPLNVFVAAPLKSLLNLTSGPSLRQFLVPAIFPLYVSHFPFLLHIL